MNRTTVALLAALEALIVVAIGLAICLVPLTVLWASQYHLGADWFAFWRAGADIWLVGPRRQSDRDAECRRPSPRSG